MLRFMIHLEILQIKYVEEKAYKLLEIWYQFLVLKNNNIYLMMMNTYGISKNIFEMINNNLPVEVHYLKTLQNHLMIGMV